MGFFIMDKRLQEAFILRVLKEKDIKIRLVIPACKRNHFSK